MGMEKVLHVRLLDGFRLLIFWSVSFALLRQRCATILKMLTCLVCKLNVELGSFVDLKSDLYDHLNGHKENGEIALALLCIQTDNCLSRVNSIKDYVNHFLNFHSAEDDYLLDLKASAFDMFLELRSKNAIPYTTSIEILDYVKTFVTSVIRKSVAIIQQEFPNNAERHDHETARVDSIISKLSSIPEIFLDFNTEWKVQKHYNRHPRFVKPEKVRLGFNETTHRFNTAQYVPIRKTLQSIVLDQEIADMLLFRQRPNSRNSNGIYEEYQDGSRYKENELFSSDTILAPKIKLQVFADGVNLNSNQRPRHNGTMFYFTLQDLVPRYNAAMANIHLIAICKSKDLKEGSGEDNGYKKFSVLL